MRRLLAHLAAPLLAGCAQVAETRVDRLTASDFPERTRIEDSTVAVLAAPLNLVPDVVANCVVGLYPGNLWPVQYVLLPLSGPYWGIRDAVEGYPFWSPSAAYE